MPVRFLPVAVFALLSFPVQAAPEKVLQPQPVVIPTESPPPPDFSRVAPPPSSNAERAAPARKAKAGNARSKAKSAAPVRKAKAAQRKRR